MRRLPNCRATSMEHNGPYAPAWRRYRRWRRAFWLVFVAFLPTVAAIDRAVRSRYGEVANSVTTWVALGALAVWWVTGLMSGNFVCPRCGGTFFSKWDGRPWRQATQSNMFARRCMQCGLPKWALRDPGAGTL